MEKMRLLKDNRSEIIIGGKYRVIRKIGKIYYLHVHTNFQLVSI